jgi:hypothetical protein
VSGGIRNRRRIKDRVGAVASASALAVRAGHATHPLATLYATADSDMRAIRLPSFLLVERNRTHDDQPLNQFLIP